MKIDGVLTRVPPAPPPPVQAPTAEALLDGITPHPVVYQCARAFIGTPLLVSQVIGAGLVARLAVASSPRPQEALDATPSPAERVLEWALHLTSGELDLIEDAAFDFSEELLKNVQTAPIILQDRCPEAQELALNVVADRDALESMAWVLGAAGRRRLRELLQEIDQLAQGLPWFIHLRPTPIQQVVDAVEKRWWSV